MLKILLFVLVMYCEANVFLNESDHGYEGITIFIQDNLSENHCEEIVTNIQNILESASDVMANATKDYYLWFKSATVVIPETWQSCGSYSVETIEYSQLSDPVIKIGSTHPIFGDNPWTSQPRQCGLPSDYMYLSQQWLQQDYDYSDKLLVEEWAKLRWGVYEEYGIQGDKIYPPVYLGEDENELMPNYCTDVLLDADIHNCSDVTNCSFQILDPQDPPVSSSLMSLWNHSQTHHFCDRSNHKAGPTKHQALCHEISVWEVMALHQDFSKTKAHSPEDTILNLSVMRPVYPSVKYMIVFEHTTTMFSLTNRWEFLRDSLSQLIAKDISSTSSVGIVQFSTQASLIYPLTLMSDDNHRQDVVSAVQNLITNSQDQSKNLTNAIAFAASILERDSVIILICDDNDVDYDYKALVEVADGNIVWSIIYGYDNYNVSMFEHLSSATGGKLVNVQNQVTNLQPVGSFQDTNTSYELSRGLRQVINHYEDKQLQTGEFVICKLNVCNLTVTSVSGHGPDLMLYVYSTITGVQDVQLEETSGYCEQVPSITYSTVKGYSCMKAHVDDEMQVDVTIRRNLVLGDVMVELVTGTQDAPYRIEVWSSHDMSSLHVDKFSLHMIFAKVIYSDAEVVGANVAAELNMKNKKIVIYLNDDGILGDVTGNDGIYTGVITTALISTGPFTYTVKANNSQLTARSLNVAAEFAVVCCGSKLQLSNNLPLLDNFILYTSEYSGLVEEVDTVYFPPGQITDMTANNKGIHVELTFTAPGGQLYAGSASQYIISIRIPEHNVTGTQQYVQAPKPVGQEDAISLNPIQCETTIIYKVAAINDYRLVGEYSNEARAVTPCHVPSTTTQTSSSTTTFKTSIVTQSTLTSTTTCYNCGDGLLAWEVVLICLGCVLFVILTVGVICYCCLKRRSNTGSNYSSFIFYQHNKNNGISKCNKVSRNTVHNSKLNLVSKNPSDFLDKFDSSRHIQLKQEHFNTSFKLDTKSNAQNGFGDKPISNLNISEISTESSVTYNNIELETTGRRGSPVPEPYSNITANYENSVLNYNIQPRPSKRVQNQQTQVDNNGLLYNKVNKDSNNVRSDYVQGELAKFIFNRVVNPQQKPLTKSQHTHNYNYNDATDYATKLKDAQSNLGQIGWFENNLAYKNTANKPYNHLSVVKHSTSNKEDQNEMFYISSV